MSRKALFTNLGGAGQANEGSSATAGDAAAPSDAHRPTRLRSRPILGSPELLSDPATTPVGAIGQSLGEFNEKAKRAEEIERKLTAGQVIIELDPALIDPSFISDRMPSSADGLADLTEAIREHGQFNPILVRPHPEIAGRFQVAFGHRRLRAVTSLGRQIKSVVRDLTDEQLVIAQGQENHERKDLSYIEKARFAHRLEQRFSRATIMASLSIYKSDLSNMLSVVSKIPEEIIDAIGPAPGIGRRSWIELADYLSKGKTASAVRKAALDPGLAPLTSDERFKRVLASTKERSIPVQSENWRAANGEPLATVVQNAKRISLTIDRQKAPEFADFVLNRLRDLYLEFEAGSSEPS
jgi:ParB family chromosome partitioning protein